MRGQLICWLVVLFVFCLLPRDSRLLSSQTPPRDPAHTQRHSPPDHFQLSPEKRAKAIAYARARYKIYFGGVLLSAAIYLLLWRVRAAVLLRDWARCVSSRHLVQCLVFVPLFAWLVFLLRLPLAYYSNFVLEHRFELSNQTFVSWMADWTKGHVVTTVLATIVIGLFYWIVRRSPRRWWFYFWLSTIPLALAFILLQPYLIEPLFFRFTPLEKTQPVLANRAEAMLRRARLDISRSRIFEMNASTKTKTMNAYFAGIGPSKRVVIWDNTIRKLGEDEILLVVGHEAGHDVLRHIAKEFVLIQLVVLAFFYLGFLALDRWVKVGGIRSGVESLGDLASLPVGLFVLTVLLFLSSPIVNAISRHYEHQADQFGIELAYGVVSDPNASGARSLEMLAEEDLDDPAPPAFIKFWLYSHPPTDDRIRFASGYRPWAEGKSFEFVHPLR